MKCNTFRTGARHRFGREAAISESGKLFAGSIPQFYDTYLVPRIFEVFAANLAARVTATGKVMRRVLRDRFGRSRRKAP